MTSEKEGDHPKRDRGGTKAERESNKKREINKNIVNEIPSPWEWERKIWESRGDISDSELIKLHDQWVLDPSTKRLQTAGN